MITAYLLFIVVAPQVELVLGLLCVDDEPYSDLVGTYVEVIHHRRHKGLDDIPAEVTAGVRVDQEHNVRHEALANWSKRAEINLILLQ